MSEKKKNQFGLTQRDMQTIYTILESYPEVKTVHIFGSRAKGSPRPGSDVDLAIMDEGISAKRIASIRNDFEESSLPYNIDLVDFTRIENPEFIGHIKRVGIPFYVLNEIGWS